MVAHQVGVQDLRGGCSDAPRKYVVFLNKQCRDAPTVKVSLDFSLKPKALISFKSESLWPNGSSCLCTLKNHLCYRPF